MTTATLVSLAITFGAAITLAQEPTPRPVPSGETAGETNGRQSVWRPREAAALGHARRLLENARSGREVRAPINGLHLPGYRIVCFGPTANGNVEPRTRATLADGLALLAWPTGEDSRRGILLHGDGTTMCCEIDTDDPVEAAPNVILGRGANGRFADILRQPGTTESGHFWLWLDQVSTRAKVCVVDGDGKPRPNCTVKFLASPASPTLNSQVSLPPGPWPLGDATTDDDGVTTVVGPRCEGLRVVLFPQPGHLARVGFSCRLVDDRILIEVADRAIRSVAADRNEQAAVATLRNIGSAQAQCQASGVIDVDGDGRGEFGYFAELAGKLNVRGDDAKKIQPPVMSVAFARVQQGSVERSGYLYRIYLPGAEDQPLPEATTGGGKGRAVDPDAAESRWCAYAWPATATSGTRMFFIDQHGDVLQCENADDQGNARQHGRDRAPVPNAALVEAGGMSKPRAIGRRGGNSEIWTRSR
ncbi:MAG: hypothetical protein NXI31_00180 [bacterium]|nr:hypothetical protein [bacterium]